MVTEQHPNDLELLALVEAELDGERRRAVRSHVESCPECAATVREVELGRTALHTAPRLELSARGRDAITEAIGREPRERRLYVSPMRLVTIFAPVAAIVVVVVALANVDLGGDDQADRAGEAAQTAEAREEGAGADALAGVVVSVQGPPREVAALLRQRGFAARVESGAVVVTGADPASVREALASRPRGAVEVRVE